VTRSLQPVPPPRADAESGEHGSARSTRAAGDFLGDDDGAGLRWRADASGRARWLSAGWLAHRGRGLDDELDEGWLQGVHPDDAEARAAVHRAALATARAQRIEYRLLRADGAYAWVLEEVEPRFTPDGPALGLSGCCVDITHLREREATLRRDRDRLARLASAVPGVVWESWNEPDASRERIDHVSEHVETLLGYTREEWLSTPGFWLTIVHPDDRAAAARRARSILESGRPGVNQYRWIARDGRVLDVRAHVQPILDARGRAVGLRGVTIDITDRVAAETALRRERDFQEALLAAQSDLGDGVVLATRARIQFANEAFCRLVKHPLVELRALSPEDLIAPDHEGRPRVSLRAADEDPARFELTLRAKDGAHVEVEVLVKRLATDASRYVAIVRDISRRKRDLEELEAARRQVAQSEKLSMLGSLVSGLAHEIRTPLAYLDNHLAIVETRVARALANGPPAANVLGDVPGHLAAAHEGVDRINRLVKDLRRFMRLGDAPRRRARLDDVVLDAVHMFEGAHGGSPHVRTQLEPTGELWLDAAQIQQVVLNLLTNAAEASPADAAILVSTRATPQGAELVVEDEGIGIPRDVMGRIYDAFFTTKQEGNGLGLAIVRRIVESHGGHVACDSEVGRGTRFSIRLPLLASRADAGAAPSA
jgi:two-component system cell cycle sensor histidine kinase/response regulator CckA